MFFMLPRAQEPAIDTESSSISFVFLSKDVDGTIGGIESASRIDLQDPTRSVIKGSVAVNTLDTDNFLRDGHLKWEKYFDEDEHPRIFL